MNPKDAQARLESRTKNTSLFTNAQTLRRTKVGGVFVNDKEPYEPEQTREELLSKLNAPPLPNFEKISSLEELASLVEAIVEGTADGRISARYGMGLNPLEGDKKFGGLPHLIDHNGSTDLDPKNPETLGTLHPSCYLGGRYSFTEIHPEDGNADSVNLVLWALGVAKVWLTIAREDFWLFHKVMTDTCATLIENGECFKGCKKGCATPAHHKCFVPTPSFLSEHGIRHELALQFEGELAIPTHHSIHLVFNLNINECISMNFGSDGWAASYFAFLSCLCPDSAIKFLPAKLNTNFLYFVGVDNLRQHFIKEHPIIDGKVCPRCGEIVSKLKDHESKCGCACVYCGRVYKANGFKSHLDSCAFKAAKLQSLPFESLSPGVPVIGPIITPPSARQAQAKELSKIEASVSKSRPKRAPKNTQANSGGSVEPNSSSSIATVNYGESPQRKKRRMIPASTGSADPVLAENNTKSASSNLSEPREGASESTVITETSVPTETISDDQKCPTCMESPDCKPGCGFGLECQCRMGKFKTVLDLEKHRNQCIVIKELKRKR
ncbi:hypothetical protein QAD02_000726 [Eretmocerus hayati]|uniref:Uncharacterized protein n=1 Tax=Eretmocerus hayati TaxID=131215 RepID=A0ACC2NE77_9HYME|nr:hypothetical protein QAD02_000726 [Eretmocerus hayati]